MLDPQQTLNCGGQLLSLASPLVMGVLNITPDSFYAGSRQSSVNHAVETGKKMLAEGADIIDVGGMSTRPGADIIDSKTERDRVIPVIKAIKENQPDCVISIDTVWADTATAAVDHGAGIINDVSAGSIDPRLWKVLPGLGVPYVLMHMRGTPETMQGKTDYEDLVTDIWDELAKKHAELTNAGLNDIIIDPGFGFGKTVAQNYELLRQLEAFRTFNRPVLAGLSRKSMIWRALDIEPTDALNGTTVLNVIALQKGAAILRVHDVRAAVEAIRLLTMVNGTARAG